MGAAEPLVLCVCLTSDRQQMTEQAIRCFRAQIYPQKQMLILDSGHVRVEFKGRDERIALVFLGGNRGVTIGALRNLANGGASNYDILVHFDSDDWSHPNRLTEQVALLQASGADAVGYNEMLFWRTPSTWECIRHGEAGCETCTDQQLAGEAWLYSNPRPNYALGTSLMYWRKTWERSPFTDGPKPEGTSEYYHWFGPGSGVRVHAEPAFMQETKRAQSGRILSVQSSIEPRMVARIHGQNQTGQYDLEKLIAGGSQEWKRVPAWDNRISDILGR